MIDIQVLREKLRREHLVVDEDCYYSCPKSGQCCNENKPEDRCECGADRHNANLEDLLRVLEQMQLDAVQYEGYALLFNDAIAVRDRAIKINTTALMLVRWARQHLLDIKVSPYEVLGQIEALLSQ